MNKPMSQPTLDDLRCLISWPPGTVGEREDLELLRQLLALCNKHGYGYVPQVAGWIRDIWNDPAVKTDFERRQQQHFKMLRGD